MTEKNLRNFVANKATDWLGLRESDGSFRKIIDIYNSIARLPGGYRMTYTDPWCAAYVSAVAQVCDLTDIIFPECACDRMIQLYKNAGRWQEDDAYEAQVGDVIFYDWDDNGIGDNVGSSDHVGLIVVSTATSFLVIEGNYSDSVKQRTIMKNARYIRGFGCPNYAAKATDFDTPIGAVVSETPEPAKITTEVSVTVSGTGLNLPQVKYGDVNGYVQSVQLILIGKGYSCGPDGADREFGKNTLTAVQSFQRANGLVVDGIVGNQTWSAILSK